MSAKTRRYWQCQARHAIAQAVCLGCNAIFCASMAYCAALELAAWSFVALGLVSLGSALLIPSRIRRLRFCLGRLSEARLLSQILRH